MCRMVDKWILIGLVAVGTYLTRIAGVEFVAERKLSPTLRLYFNYLPVGVISALVVKQILNPAGGIGGVVGPLNISVPVLVGCTVTAVTIKKTESFLPSVVLGALAGLLARYFL